MLVKIKNRWTGDVLFSLEAPSLKEAVESAVKSKNDLSGADLIGADLSGANLSGANLFKADLFKADLFEANLSGLSRQDTV